MFNNGDIIGERYSIISLVGTGGMAYVYNAIDTRLNRRVAIKVLKDEYSSDKSFITKFKAEAQSAARLSHPNIVNVYDVGEEGNVHYIVMELVEGITLKKFIEKRGKLDVNTAVGIAIQIAQGMEAAHASHIIHRDIKPQNIIISKEGKVKVTDFGIAKVATSNTIAAGQAIGSVHYISPEQARGGYLDEKSDIYSLGVTLYEMISGRMPFAADNTVSVALLHIQEEAIPLRELDPEIPLSIERIVQKCMQKKPERRYLTATELIDDLKKAIIEPDGDFVNIAQAVTDSPTINISGEELQRIKKARYHEENSVKTQNSKNRRISKDIREIPEDDEKMDPRFEKLILFSGIAAIVILAIVVIFLLVKGFKLFGKGGDTSSVSGISTTVSGSSVVSNAASKTSSASTSSEKLKVTVPDLKGKTLADAIIMLSEAGIKSYKYNYEPSDDVKKEEVISVEPEAGTEIDKDEQVVITVSEGKEETGIPDVTSVPQETAVSTLEGMKFVVLVKTKSSDEVEKGKVIETIPKAGTSAKEGDKITVVVSSGPEEKKVKVPELLGLGEAEAIKNLRDAGFEVKVVYEDNDSVEKGKVITQSAQNTELPEGSKITITVSKGPKVTYTYTASVLIDANPFAEEGESGSVKVVMEQNGKSKTIYSGELSYEDFPLQLNNIKGADESEGICYLYLDGELYTDKIWRIKRWNKEPR